MLKFYHAALSRSGRVLWLLRELAIPFELLRTEIPRRDGSGSRDPRNPQPEGKVHALEQDGEVVTETGAIMTPEALKLTCAPVADGTRYDSLRRAI